MSVSLPRLYSFRRCPYAMRARFGLLFAELKVELREVVLKNKPAQMLAISPKGTVPVLELAEGDSSRRLVIEESRDILEWALRQNDPQGLLNIDLVSANTLIDQNDNEFKFWLDRYKYADRHPGLTQPVSALYPSRSHLAPQVHTFIEWLREQFPLLYGRWLES